MKNLTTFLLALLTVCLPATLLATPDQEQDDDSRYLAGAVPEVDGKVVFIKEFSIPGMTQDEVFRRMKEWMDARLKRMRTIAVWSTTIPKKDRSLAPAKSGSCSVRARFHWTEPKFSTSFPWFANRKSASWK